MCDVLIHGNCLLDTLDSDMLTEGENLNVFSIFVVDNSAPGLMMTLVGSVLSCQDHVCWPGDNVWFITSTLPPASICYVVEIYLDLKLTTALHWRLCL